MPVKTLFSAYAAFAAVSGTALLLVPSTVMSFYGAPSLDFAGTSLARDVGTVLVGLAVMCWMVRNEDPSNARKALTLGLTVVNGLWALLSVIAGIHVGGWLVWAEVPFFGLVSILFLLAGRSG